MTRITNPAGLLDRLRQLQRTRYPNIPPNAMLLLYARQGLLARLEASPYADTFVLKGALNLFARYGETARPTQDIDLASRGLPNTPVRIREVLTELCRIPFGDGLTFTTESIQTSTINEALEYPGVTARFQAHLGPSRVTLQLDFSFGNVSTPAPVQLTFPALLLDEAVRVAAYPLETVITEKFAAPVEIGEATTRLKNLYDLQVILSRETFEAGMVREALIRSFMARGTPAALVPEVLSVEFAASLLLTARWTQYLRRTRLEAPPLTQVMRQLQAFHGPLLLEEKSTGI